MNTNIYIYTYDIYNSSDINGFAKYINILIPYIQHHYSTYLIKSIKLIDFINCSTTLNNFNNNNHDSINISMNIHELLKYILKNIYALYAQTKDTAAHTNVISNLNKYSLLLNYICCILYIQNTPNSLNYFIELLEYGQIFDTISKVISREILTFTFYTKSSVQNSYPFNHELRENEDLRKIIREKNNNLYKLLFEAPTINIFKLDENSKDILIKTYIDKICDILVKREGQIYLEEQISTEVGLSKIISTIIDKFESYLRISLHYINLKCNVWILYNYYIDPLYETIQYLQYGNDNTPDGLNKLNKLYTFFDVYKSELNYLLYILYLEKKFDIIYNMIEYSDIFKTISEYLKDKINNQEIDKTYTFNIKVVNYTDISDIDENELIAHMKKYNTSLYKHIENFGTSSDIKLKFENRLCEFIKSISPAAPAVSAPAAPAAVVSPAVIAPATVVSAPAVVVSAPAAAVSVIAPVSATVVSAPPAAVSVIAPAAVIAPVITDDISAIINDLILQQETTRFFTNISELFTHIIICIKSYIIILNAYEPNLVVITSKLSDILDFLLTNFDTINTNTGVFDIIIDHIRKIIRIFYIRNLEIDKKISKYIIYLLVLLYNREDKYSPTDSNDSFEIDNLFMIQHIKMPYFKLNNIIITPDNFSTYYTFDTINIKDMNNITIDNTNAYREFNQLETSLDIFIDYIEGFLREFVLSYLDRYAISNRNKFEYLLLKDDTHVFYNNLIFLLNEIKNNSDNKHIKIIYLKIFINHFALMYKYVFSESRNKAICIEIIILLKKVIDNLSADTSTNIEYKKIIEFNLTRRELKDTTNNLTDRQKLQRSNDDYYYTMKVKKTDSKDKIFDVMDYTYYNDTYKEAEKSVVMDNFFCSIIIDFFILTNINVIKNILKIEYKKGGHGNNKYKKTENKITVIYKKKEYTRVIYICERKKYIKINKTYILLSKLKKV